MFDIGMLTKIVKGQTEKKNNPDVKLINKKKNSKLLLQRFE